MRSGAYYFVDLQNKWHRLAEGYPEALAALAALLKSSAPVNTIDQIIGKYEAEELPAKAAATQVGRRQEFKTLRAVFGTMAAGDIKPHHVWQFWRERRMSVQARHEIRCLSTLLTFARRCGALDGVNPCFGLQLPNAAPRDRYVTDEEFALVHAGAQPMIRYAMELALLLGTDSGTVRSLERRHLTDAGIKFTRRKTGVEQLIEWNDELSATVDALKREAPQLRRFLICTRQGKQYSAHGFQAQWQRAMLRAVKAGLQERFTFHDLRAKSASDDATDQGAADRLGHGDVKLTQKVYRRLPRRAAALTMVRDK